MSDQLPKLHSRLVPFGDLTQKNKSTITENKNMFPDNATLRANLKKLGAPELEDYLVWIPYSTFKDIELVGKGAFASVYKASVVHGITRAYQKVQVVALKEDPKKTEVEFFLYSLFVSHVIVLSLINLKFHRSW